VLAPREERLAVSERTPDLVIERMPDWNYGAFLDEEVASCIAIGATAQEALNNGMRELLKRAQQKGEKMPTFEKFVEMCERHKMRIADGKTVIGSLALWYNEIKDALSPPAASKSMFPYTDSAKPLPEEIELYGAAMAYGYKLVPIDQPAASEERGLRESNDEYRWLKVRIDGRAASMIPDDNRYYVVFQDERGKLEGVWVKAAALQSLPSSPPAPREKRSVRDELTRVSGTSSARKVHP